MKQSPTLFNLSFGEKERIEFCGEDDSRRGDTNCNKPASAQSAALRPYLELDQNLKCESYRAQKPL